MGGQANATTRTLSGIITRGPTGLQPAAPTDSLKGRLWHFPWMSRKLMIFQTSHSRLIIHRLVSLVKIILRIVLNLAGEKFNFTILYVLVIPFGIALLLWIILKILQRRCDVKFEPCPRGYGWRRDGKAGYRCRGGNHRIDRLVVRNSSQIIVRTEE